MHCSSCSHENEGKVLTHHFLLNQVLGANTKKESQCLRVFVAQLRKKIEVDPNRPSYLLAESVLATGSLEIYMMLQGYYFSLMKGFCRPFL